MYNLSYNNIIYMKYGVHASESIESIVKRKMQEIEVCQKMFWGYGGTICHPTNQVQPFLERNLSKGEKTYLLLSKTLSELNNDPTVALAYSVNHQEWVPIPEGITVLGSKYAIICKNIQQCNFSIDLADYVVPIGNSKGRKLSDYIQGQVSKACGQYCKNTDKSASRIVNITLCAEITEPFAVFLENN